MTQAAIRVRLNGAQQAVVDSVKRSTPKVKAPGTCPILECTSPVIHELAEQVRWAITKAGFADDRQYSGLWFPRPKKVPRFDTLPWFLTTRRFLEERSGTTYALPSDNYAIGPHGKRWATAKRAAKFKMSHGLARDYLIYLMTRPAEEALLRSTSAAANDLRRGRVPEYSPDLWRVV